MTNKLGQILKTTRDKKNMSLREFSEYLGISHTYLNKLEKGIGTRANNNISPTIDTVTKIAAALNISLIDFMWQCGYFDYSSVKEFSDDSFKNKEIELKQYVERIKLNLLYAEQVTYDGKPISDTDLRVISGTLEVGLDILLRENYTK